MVVQHNIMALNAYNRLSSNNASVSKNLEKLSSGYKINRAGDDAAGLAISEKMRAQITGLERASDNAQDGISLVQTAEGALTEVHSMLNRMVELATQSANGTYDNTTDRANLQKEVISLQDEINRIAKETNFNGINLLDGSMGGTTATVTFTAGTGNATTGTGAETVIDLTGKTGADVIGGGVTVDGKTYEFVKTGEDVTISGATKVEVAEDAADTALATALNTALGTIPNYGSAAAAGKVTITSTATGVDTVSIAAEQVGKGLGLQIGDTASQRISVRVGNMDSKSLGVDITAVDISTETGATSAIASIKGAINKVSSTRADLGAIQNRLEYTVNNLATTTENMTSAESRIRDTDMAKEMMAYTKNNVLSQAAQAMLAQANQQPQQVLQLLR